MDRYATPYGVFFISPFPGQPQIAHCHGFFVPVESRGKGYAHRLKRIQNEILRNGLFDYATCTVAGCNAAQQRVLEKAGWQKVDEFDNSQSGGTTQVWRYKIKQ